MLKLINYVGPFILLVNGAYLTIEIVINFARDACAYPQYELLLVVMEFGLIFVIILWLLGLLTERHNLLKPYLYYICMLMYWYIFVVIQNLQGRFIGDGYRPLLPWYKALIHCCAYGVAAINYYENITG